MPDLAPPPADPMSPTEVAPDGTLVEDAAPAVEPTAATCQACGASQLGLFCHDCGQHFLDGPITIRRLVRDFSERFLKLERGLLGTFLSLCRGPGALARRYVGGCRRPYVNPLSYVFIAAAASLLFLPYIMSAGDDGGQWQQSMDMGRAFAENMNGDLSPQQQAAFDDTIAQAFPLLMDSLTETMKQLSSVFAFVAALIMAAFFRLFFGPRYTYAETAVATLYGTGHYYLLAIPLAASTLWLSDGLWIYSGLTALLFGGLTVWTALGFYDRSWRTGGLAAVSFAGTYVLYTVGVMGLAGIVSVWRVAPEVREIAQTVRAAHGL